MDFPQFAAEVIIISSSGVLSPGPLFFANLLYGSRQGLKAGIKMAHGHTVVELPLIILLSAGFVSFLSLKQYTDAIGIIGGVGILAFAAFQIIGFLRKKAESSAIGAELSENRKGPFVTGIVLTAANPFFLVWWFTAGLKLISDSALFGIVAGIAILFSLHIWMDYVWLAFTAHMASKGISVLKSKYYPLVTFGLAVVLVYYGIQFVVSSLD